MIDLLNKLMCYLPSAKLDPGTARFTFGVLEFLMSFTKNVCNTTGSWNSDNSVKRIKRAPVQWVAVRVEPLWAFCSARLPGRVVSKLKQHVLFTSLTLKILKFEFQTMKYDILH